MPFITPLHGGLLGVLGGMGPAATNDFLLKLVRFAPAERDDQHLPCVVSNDPRLPDRTKAWQDGEEDKVFSALLARLRQLEKTGANLIVMPCNSAHHWAEKLLSQTRLPMIHIADASLGEAMARFPQTRCAAILSTPLTLASGFYQQRLRARGVTPLLPSGGQADLIFTSIQRIKAGQTEPARRDLTQLADEMFRDGADIILLACTEIPLVLSEDEDARLIDTSAALARAALRAMHPSFAGLTQPV